MTAVVLTCVVGSFVALACYAIYVEIDERRWRRYFNETIRKDRS